MPVSDDFMTCGLTITGHFEDSTDPLAAVSGDFDGMGISLGVLQWNIGSASLQPIVRAIGRAAVLDAMPALGSELWKACAGTVSDGLAIVRAWQDGRKLRPAARAELKAYVRSAPFQAQQLKVARKVGDKVFAAATDWARKFGKDAATKREFCWFYDVFTQNGGMRTVTPKIVDDFLRKETAPRAVELVGNWLRDVPADASGSADAMKNADLWRDETQGTEAILLVASYLRAMLSKAPWRADVLNRKGTIAVGTGWVHGSRHDLQAITG